MTMDLALPSELDSVYGDIERYYTEKVLRHGPTAAGVDWSCSLTQALRFVQLLKLCDFSKPFSVNDIGCGYGALLSFLDRRHRRTRIDYWGVDLSPQMIEEAQRQKKNVCGKFSVARAGVRRADYSIASGIFHVKLKQTADAWTQFICNTLADMHASSTRGFAVNFLAPLPDGTAAKSELYRAPHHLWRAYCEQTFDARVTVIENYGMREYTLLVRYPSALVE